MDFFRYLFKKRDRKEVGMKPIITPPPKIYQQKVKVLRPLETRFPVSSPYGVTRTINGRTRSHYGIDFSCPEGTAVHAMADGKVFRSGWEKSPEKYPDNYKKKGLGLRIWQEAEVDGIKIYLWYGHLSKTLTRQGIVVTSGSVIAMSGNTGSSTGPHLHVQARIKDTNKYTNLEFFT